MYVHILPHCQLGQIIDLIQLAQPRDVHAVILTPFFQYQSLYGVDPLVRRLIRHSVAHLFVRGYTRINPEARHAQRGETGYQHRIICQQDMSAVTAACLMVKKSVFDEVGGLTEELAVAFNDIDFCMKIRKAESLIVSDPFAELYHYESKSRGLDQGNPEKVRRFEQEVAIFRKRWPEILRDGDPYYNPNLSMVTQDFSLKRN